jgi:hypothetical protein
METSTNNPSDGITEQTPNINSNQQPDSNIDMNEMNDQPIMLKQAAARYDCAASSLKNNIKSGKLAATQTDEKAPYMVRPSDVERFLRDTPGIASTFHPAPKPAPAADEPASADETPAAMTGQEAGSPTSKAPGGGQELAIESALSAAAETSGSGDTAVEHAARVPDAHSKPSAQTAEGGSKRRRRRRRGKGGAGTPTPTGIQQPVLKALAGTTPQERLRLTACLTELLGLVASA